MNNPHSNDGKSTAASHNQHAPVQSLWIGERLSRLERLCVLSYLRNGHPFHLYVYDEVKDVPAAAVVLDAADILPYPKTSAPLEARMRALFADWFRWELLYRHGGIWSDMDCVCLKPLDDLPAAFVPLETCETPPLAGVSLMQFPPQHPVSQAMRRRASHPYRLHRCDDWRMQCRRLRSVVRSLLKAGRLPKPSDPELETLGWGTVAGPRGVSRYLHHQRRFALARTGILQMDRHERERLFTCPQYAEALMSNDWYAVHVYNASLIEQGIDMASPGAAGAFYARMLEHYGVG